MREMASDGHVEKIDSRQATMAFSVSPLCVRMDEDD